MQRKHNVNFRVSDVELAEIRRIAERWGVPHSEVWRRLLTTVKVLYNSDLTLSDALKPDERTLKIMKFLEKIGDPPLYKVMKSIPELIRILDAKEIMRMVRRGKRAKKG